MILKEQFLPPGERLVVRGNQRTLRLSHLGFEVIAIVIVIIIIVDFHHYHLDDDHHHDVIIIIM